MTRYYDKKNQQLIYIAQDASPEYWDTHWEVDESIRQKLLNISSTYISRITQRHLKPEEGIILEGGCGYGLHVAALVNNGYQCIGIDLAPKTVAFLQKNVPEFDVRLGDVQQIELSDDYVVGYWSIGVIEHFAEGYDVVAKEMSRVIKPNGLLFLTFPYMSPLRKLKAKLGHYPMWKEGKLPPSFYQFALNHKQVIDNFVSQGFTLKTINYLDGLKGLKDELNIFKSPLQNLYSYRGRSIFIRGGRLMFSNLLAPLTAHSILLIFRRK